MNRVVQRTSCLDEEDILFTVCIDKGIHSFFNFREFGGELKIKKLKIDFWDSKTCPSIQNWILAPKVKTGEIFEIRGFVADRLQLGCNSNSAAFDLAMPFL